MKRALFWLAVAIVAAPFVYLIGYMAYIAWQIFGWWSVSLAAWIGAACYAMPTPMPHGQDWKGRS